MRTLKSAAMTLTSSLLICNGANAATMFFNNDLAGFAAASTTSLTDFEGIVDPGSGLSGSAFTIDGATPTPTQPGPQVWRFAVRLFARGILSTQL